jgi:glycosyltransferase involved in cell wall biosynthesis
MGGSRGGVIQPEVVSLIIAVKNGARTLQRCLDSALRQTGVHLEVLVIDGGSSDGSVDIIKANEHALSYWISEPDSGLFAAWNKGVRQARGAWIAFLGADDVFHDEGVLHDLLEAAERNGARVVYGRMNLVAQSGVVLQTVGEPWAACRKHFVAGFMIPHPGTLHHRSIFDDHGLFDESYRTAGDYELLLRELLDRDAAFVDRPVANMQVGGISARAQTIHSVLREVTRARAAHGMRDVPMRLRVALVTSWIGARIHRYVGHRAFAAVADAYRLIRGKPRIWTV